MSNEVAAHRFVVAPRARAGEPASEGLGDACERLRRWPGCRNGCRRRSGYGRSRSPRVAYVARLAQEAAERALVESRRGVDEGKAGFTMKVGVIRSCMARGLSPAQIAALHPELGALDVDDIPLGRRRLRRHDQHGAQAEGRLQAQKEGGRGEGGAARRAQVARRVHAPARGRARRRC